jgi:hypothetical protein
MGRGFSNNAATSSSRAKPMKQCESNERERERVGWREFGSITLL